MLNSLVSGNSNIKNFKYSRVVRRKDVPFSEIDKNIKESLEILEQNDQDLWTNPEYNKNEFVHSIFQYPAMMVPEVQRQIIDVIVRNSNSQNITSMIDPFMGSSTSLIASMHYGMDCYGQDINPLAILISKVRTSLININLNSLKKKIKELQIYINNDDSNIIECKYPNLNKWFKPIVQIELSKIVRAIRKEEKQDIRRFYWASLAEAIRITSNDRTSTYKLHARPIEQINDRDLSPIKEFYKQLTESVEGYLVFKKLLRKKGRINQNGYKGHIFINNADSVNSINFNGIDESFAELLVSSPPYGDNHTTVPYGQYSFLQLYWIDLKDIHEGINIDVLKTTAQIDNISVGGKKSDKELLEKVKYLSGVSTSFKSDFKKFETFEQAKINKIVIFLHDLDEVLQNSIKALKSNSYMIWTMGDRHVENTIIRNVLYLREMLEAKACVHVHSIERTILNKRMATKNNNGILMNKEEIIIFRKIG